MRLPAPSPVRPARAPRLVPLSGDAFVCCWRSGWVTWSFAYLLRGSFGNYLLGEPPFDGALARAGQGIGGIASVLPFRPGFGPDASRWFRRFGCEWIAPEAAGRGPAPVRALGHTTLPGLDEWSCVESRGRYGWRFRWRQRRVQAGLLEARPAGDRSSLGLPGRFRGSWSGLREQIAAMQAAFAEVTPSAWLAEELGGQSLVCWPIDSLGLIACFDDTEFERHDIDIIGPRARAQLAELLDHQRFERLSAHCYRRDAITIRISRPPRTVTSEVEPLRLGPGEMQFVTSTQAAFHLLLAGGPLQERLGEIERLVARLPLNLGKVESLMERRPGLTEGADRRALLTDWRRLQAGAATYYRNRTPDGIRGKLFQGA